jgi:hypothetical protein
MGLVQERKGKILFNALSVSRTDLALAKGPK